MLISIFLILTILIWPEILVKSINLEADVLASALSEIDGYFDW